MNKEDAAKVLAHLSDKWQGRPCPMCQSGEWSVQSKIFELREYRGGSFVVGGVPILPVVPITCGNCGNTLLINAIKLGVLKPGQGQ